MTTVTLTQAECKALYEIIDQLSGFNAGNVFAGETDDPKDPIVSACAKVFMAAGKNVPANVRAALTQPATA